MAKHGFHNPGMKVRFLLSLFKLQGEWWNDIILVLGSRVEGLIPSFPSSTLKYNVNLIFYYCRCARLKHTDSYFSLCDCTESSFRRKTKCLWMWVRAIWFCSFDFWYPLLLSCYYFYYLWYWSFVPPSLSIIV
jgi:hypothetical protein